MNMICWSLAENIRPQIKRTLALLSLTLLMAMPTSTLATEGAFTFTILNFRGAEITRNRWQPLANYLSEQLSVPVIIEPLRHDALLNLANQSDMLLANPVIIRALLQHNDGYQVIATLNSRLTGDRYAGDILVRSDSPITRMDQLQGKVIGVVNQSTSAGGYLFQAQELKKLGWQPLQDHVTFIDLHNQYAILQRIINRQVDAGFVRSTLLAETRAFTASQFRILPPLNPADQPHTTPTYPHWGFVVSDRLTPTQIATVKKALLSLSADTAVAEAAGIRGFVTAADYQVVEGLTRTTVSNSP